MVLADHVFLPQRNPQRGLCKTKPRRVLPYLALTFSTLLSSQETDPHQLLTLPGFPRCGISNLSGPEASPDTNKQHARGMCSMCSLGSALGRPPDSQEPLCPASRSA